MLILPQSTPMVGERVILYYWLYFSPYESIVEGGLTGHPGAVTVTVYIRGRGPVEKFLWHMMGQSVREPRQWMVESALDGSSQA